MKKKTNPLISVIIPAFNAQRTIERSVNSVLTQTYETVELIVINDCSQDQTLSILKSLQRKGATFKLIDNKKNKGVSASRNHGIEKSSGQWITFLDSDDYLIPNYFESVHHFFPEREFICTSYVQFGTKRGEIIKDHQISTNLDLSDEVLLDYLERYYLRPYQNTAFVHCWNKFFSKNIIEKHTLRFNENLNQLEDVDFVFRFIGHTEKRFYVDEPAIFHEVNKQVNSLSWQSGSEDDGVQKLTIALDAPMKLKRKLLAKYGIDEVVIHDHFFCSMVILFCIRLSRQFWQTYRFSSFRKLYNWLSHPVTRKLSPNFHYVDGESKIFAFSFWHLHPVISSMILLINRR